MIGLFSPERSGAARSVIHAFLLAIQPSTQRAPKVAADVVGEAQP
jgi:hypothetical protein